MMTIRPISMDELKSVRGLADEFHRVAYREPINWDLFLAFWLSILSNGAGVLLVGEVEGVPVGAIGGMWYPDPYSGRTIAMEFFWYVRPEHRGYGTKLLNAFEEWAAGVPADEVRMVHLQHSMPEKLAVLYRRRGYAPIETHWGKRMNQAGQEAA